MGIRRKVRARHISLLPLLAAAALIAGCGSSSGSSGSTAATSSASSTGQTGTSSATTPTSSSTGTSRSSTPSTGASAVAACKRGVEAMSQLKPSTREHLETICEKAAGGDVSAKRKATEEACRELVNASPLPAGAAKERALAACKHAGGK